MDLGLDERVVLVTGASGGIGRSVAAALAEEGARVVLHGHRGVDGLRTWLDEQPWRERAVVLAADVRDADALEAGLRSATEGLGRLHGCVVNAGIWPPEDTPLVDLDAERIRAVMDVNVLGAFWTTRAFLRLVRERGADPGGDGASIVYTGSTAAKFGERGHSDYAASKSALAGLMRSVKNEITALDPYGRVNIVEPGWTVTEMTAKNLDAPGVIEKVVRTMPVQQLAAPEDIAATVLWLLSPRMARHVSGETITVAGGMEGRVLREEFEVDPEGVKRRLGLA